MFREIKYWIADHLFEYELDDAYSMGIREGMRLNASRVKLELEFANRDMTATQQIGYNKAMEAVKNVN